MVMTLRVSGVDLQVWNEGIFCTKKRGQYCVAGGVWDPRFACVFRHLLHLNQRSDTTEPVFIGQADIKSFRPLLSSDGLASNFCDAVSGLPVVMTEGTVGC
jgi:hypothetical protein